MMLITSRMLPVKGGNLKWILQEISGGSMRHRRDGSVSAQARDGVSG